MLRLTRRTVLFARLVSISAFLPLLGLGTLGLTPAVAHHNEGDEIQGPPGHDRPGPPPIITRVKLTTVQHPDMDDGGGDAEVTITISVIHEGHGTVSKSITEPDLDYDITGGTWEVNQDIYAHRECTPMETIRILVQGLEADASNLDFLESALLNAISSLIEDATLGNDVGILSRIIAGALAAVNPDDTLGNGSNSFGGPGSGSVTTSGGDYSITANFEITTEVVDGGECDPDSIPPTDDPPPFCFFSHVYFDSIIGAWDDVDGIVVEAGDPGHVTPQDLVDAKNCVRSAMVGLARWEAARMVEDARGLQGFGPALSQYQSGTQNSGLAAIGLYRGAFCNAEAAIRNGVFDPSAPPMSPRSVAVPTSHATRAGRTVEYLVGVFGDNAAGVLITSVSGGPPGTSFVLEPADPHHPSWRYLRVTQAGPPGTYGLVVHFSNPQVGPLSLVLDVDDASPTDIGEDPEVERLAAFRMQAIAPSPVVETGMLRVDLARPASLTLTVFDVSGRKVREIASGAPQVAGQHVFMLDARSLRAGVYYVRMQAAALDGRGARTTTVQKFVVAR